MVKRLVLGKKSEVGLEGDAGRRRMKRRETKRAIHPST
jgi:hypothetical protein